MYEPSDGVGAFDASVVHERRIAQFTTTKPLMSASQWLQRVIQLCVWWAGSACVYYSKS